MKYSKIDSKIGYCWELGRCQGMLAQEDRR